ncbi:MAG: radical SAM protein [Candidatus Thorarchaeota archaeon]|nr:radical SAM protein [Candidatus Thorarchaeota archaeon]
MDEETLLRLKIRLLTEGARLPDTESGVRKGGAGPVGSRYFILPNGRACGVAVRDARSARVYGSAVLEPTDDERIWLYDGRFELRTVPRPQFYDLRTADGVPFYKIALLHGSSTLATTAYQMCRYWKTGEQCRFCTIPTSLQSGDTILEKTPEQIANVVRAALAEGVVSDLLITTGTPESEDMGINRIVAIVKRIRDFSDVPIGVQFEPPTDLEHIERVAAAGVNAVGMHLECADEKLRMSMCPGKQIHGPTDLYRRCWTKAVGHFGRGNVSTFLLHGLGENTDSTLKMAEDVCQLGVLPVVTPFRPASGSRLSGLVPSYVGRGEENIDFYKRVGALLYRSGLNPADTSAGCHKCGGCTPIQEAYDWARHNA